VPRTGHSLYFLALAAVEAIIIISLEATVFGIFFGTKCVYTINACTPLQTEHNTDIIIHRFNSPDQLGQGIPIYLIIFIFSQVFQVLLAIDAVSTSC
jgi:hypothetical protein